MSEKPGSRPAWEPAGLVPVSRRELLFGGSALVGVGGLSGCATPTWDSQDPDSGEPVVDFFVHRAEDQVRLRFTFWNARLIPLLGQAISLRKRDRNRPYLVRVEFPEQHVGEQAFYEDSTGGEAPSEPPISALLSGKSRLVFEIDWTHRRFFPLTLENLLDWSSWRMRLVPAIRPKAAVAPPGPSFTNIEAPFRLSVSPGETDRWATPRRLPQRGRREALWGARLIASDPAEKPSLRAVWTPDFGSKAEHHCFRSSLGPIERHHLVLLTHTEEHAAEAIAPDLLLLTSQGAWISLRKEFDRAVTQNKGLLKSWEHQADRGRDRFVQVEWAAVLYPFGFSVSVIITTERKLNASPSKRDTGFLRQRIQIKFEELKRNYAFWDMPFTSLSPVETLSPPLDEPEDLYDAIEGWRNGCFWPKVARRPYEFKFKGVDHDGQEIAFTAPVICIMEVDAHAQALLTKAMAEYETGELAWRQRAFGGAQVATSPSETIGRTAVGVEIMQFSGRLMAEQRDEIPWRGFEPRVPELSARLSGASANHAIAAGPPTWFAPYNLEAPNNHNQVFLIALPGKTQTKVSFSGRTSESGGFIAPRFSVGGVSRINGAFGEEPASLRAGGSFASGSFNPSDFFGADAKLFGGVSLSEIFERVILKPAGISAPAMLSQLEEYTDSLPFWQHSFTWETDRLKSSNPIGKLEPILLVAQDAKDNVPQEGVPTVLTANGRAVVPIFDPEGAYAEFRATISNFCLQLVAFDEGIRLKVNSCSFTASSGAKSKFEIDIVDYELVGTMMSFVKMLQEFFSQFSNDTPIEISPKGVTLSLPSIDLPPITLGAFNLDNVRIISGAFLPFNGDPLEFWFALSSPDDPFMVTVGLFGGGGHFRLVIDCAGVKSIDASFRFGAFKEINIGGVVKGRGFILGGLSYGSKRISNPSGPGKITRIDYCAFVHAGGSGTVLGFISISIDIHVGLYIEKVGETASKMYGAVVVRYSFKIGFFKKSVSVRYEKTIAGSGSVNLLRADSRAPAASHMTREQWHEYRQAFA